MNICTFKYSYKCMRVNKLCRLLLNWLRYLCRQTYLSTYVCIYVAYTYTCVWACVNLCIYLYEFVLLGASHRCEVQRCQLGDPRRRCGNLQMSANSVLTWYTTPSANTYLHSYMQMLAYFSMTVWETPIKLPIIISFALPIEPIEHTCALRADK